MRSAILSICLLGLLLSSGCGPNRRAVYPARGKIVDAAGKPAAGATIILHPVKTAPDDNLHKPAGNVDDDGNFILTTYATNDGAPAGEYVATIEWRPLPKTPFEAEKPDRLQGKFRNVSESPFKLTIEPKENELAPIKLP